MKIMKIKISRSQKIELLKCLQKGEFDTEIFPELYKLEPAKILTKEQAKQLWSDLDNGEFDKILRPEFWPKQ